MTTSEKVAYLKGLVEGFGLAGGDSKESKILAQILDILEDLSLDVDDLDASVEELNEGLDAVSDDLEDLDNVVYEEWDEDDEDECECCGDEDDELCYEVTCPECGDSICFDEDTLDSGSISCPNCGAKLEFEPEDIEEISLETRDEDEE